MDINEIIEFIKANYIYGLLILNVIILIVLIIILNRQSKLNKKYKKFMTGEKAENLEQTIINRFKEIDGLKDNIKNIKVDIENINEDLMTTYKKIGIIRYDAFREMGGKLSFVLALLNKNNNGFIINSVHSSREGSYVYLKEIINGESFLELSSEEKEALKQALNADNYLV